MEQKIIFYSLPNADHPWLQNAKKAPNVSLGETVRARLKQFSVMNKLKKRALRVMFCHIYFNLIYYVQQVIFCDPLICSVCFSV